MEQESGKGKPDTGYRGMTVVLVVVLTLVLATALSLSGIAYLNHLSSLQLKEQLVEVKNQALEEMVTAQERALSRREWVDQEKGKARIPIEDAMKVMARGFAEKDGR